MTGSCTIMKLLTFNNPYGMMILGPLWATIKYKGAEQ